MNDKLQAVLERGRARRRLPAPAVRRLLRERAGLTQAELATVLDVARPTITRWESSVREPRGVLLTRYLDVLDRLAGER